MDEVTTLVINDILAAMTEHSALSLLHDLQLLSEWPAIGSVVKVCKM